MMGAFNTISDYKRAIQEEFSHFHPGLLELFTYVFISMNYSWYCYLVCASFLTLLMITPKKSNVGHYLFTTH